MRILAITLLLVPIAALAQTAAPVTDGTWNFVVAGDSRNCGDVVMPAIAEAAKNHGAKFYWHLGDYRAVYTFDEDMAQAAMMSGTPLQVLPYLRGVFKDAIDNQIKAFEDRGVPTYLGLGNHETIWPLGRAAFVKAFSAYLDRTEIHDQRLKDDPNDTTVRTYFHVIRDGIDFITLDNATCDMFDDAQMAWLKKVLERDSSDPSIHTVIAGMHAALPDSRSCGHSMGNYPNQQATGREVYKLLLALRDKNKKHVYVMASHSHFVMENVYDTEYWRANGGVLNGWIVGTSGAVRYRLPEGVTPGPNVRTDVYGYLLATVSPNGSISFAFHELTSKDIPADVVKKYSKNFIENFCFAANRDLQPQESGCPPFSKCSVSN